MRVFLKQLATKLTVVRFESVEKLSKQNEKRYAQMLVDARQGKNISPSFDDADEMMKYLKSGAKIGE